MYVSIINNNQNNNPSSTATAWTQWDLLKRWNTNESYNTGDPVIASNGFLYTSLIDSNLGDNPILNSGDWTLPEADRRSINYLINPNFAINQESFGGGQPAAGVYGFDMWKGDAGGTQIEQVVENAITINESFVISWVGGTGTATVDGAAGLASGDTFTLSTSANFSVIVPTDATFIQLESGVSATGFEYRSIGDELALCQRYYYPIVNGVSLVSIGAGQSVTTTQAVIAVGMKVTMRAAPTLSVSNVAHFAAAAAGGADLTATAVAISGTATENSVRLSFTVASGLVAGNASTARSISASAVLALISRL